MQWTNASLTNYACKNGIFDQNEKSNSSPESLFLTKNKIGNFDEFTIFNLQLLCIPDFYLSISQFQFKPLW